MWRSLGGHTCPVVRQARALPRVFRVHEIFSFPVLSPASTPPIYPGDIYLPHYIALFLPGFFLFSVLSGVRGLFHLDSIALCIISIFISFFPIQTPTGEKKKSFRPVFRFCFPVRSSRQAVVRQLQQPIRPLDKPIRSNHLSIYRNGANQWRYGALERLVSTISGFLNCSISAASIPLLW